MDAKGKIQRLTQEPTHSWLFAKFMLGRYVKQDQAMDVKLLCGMWRHYPLKLLEHGLTEGPQRKIYMCGFAYVVLFCKALWGGKVLLTEDTTLCSMISKSSGCSRCGTFDRTF